MTAATLDAFLNSYAGQGDSLRPAVAATIRQLAEAAVKIRHVINQGVLGAAFAGTRGANADGDIQKDLDVFADDIFLDAMRHAPVALYASEELEQPVLLDQGRAAGRRHRPARRLLQHRHQRVDRNDFLPPPCNWRAGRKSGRRLFAGGNEPARAPASSSTGRSLRWCCRSAAAPTSSCSRPGSAPSSRPMRAASFRERTQEFAINAANYRHWDEAVRLYVDDCLKGCEGPRERDFNMRWIASLVADCYRILVRGGVFLYPGDSRKGYHQGRLRLVYEANPIAYLVEQAGGAATDTVNRILDIVPESLHQRIAAWSSARRARSIASPATTPTRASIGERAPLFGNRGLFRA